MRSLVLLALLLVACKPAASPPATGPTSWRLLEEPWAATWQAAGIPDQAEIEVAQGELSLPAGQPMTGAKFPRWQAPEFPVTNYAITYEALRVEGDDFFGTVSFPVGSSEAHASFVLGGWGGTVTGISNIDFSDANENQTRAEQQFENNRWYRVRVEVKPEELRAWIDDRLVVNVSIKGRQISLRQGFIDHCKPFGFATYDTAGRIRAVVIMRL